MQTKLFFFHGLESGPHGSKYQSLKAVFSDIQSPNFEGVFDINERVKMAEEVTRGMTNIFAVGSSFGGLLAALMYHLYPERFAGYLLLVPALQDKEAQVIDKVPATASIIYTKSDELIPADVVEGFAEKFKVKLIEVDDIHPLPASHQVIIDEMKQLLKKC